MKSRFRKRGGGHGSVGARGGGQGGGEGVHRTVTQWRPIAPRTLFRKGDEIGTSLDLWSHARRQFLICRKHDRFWTRHFVKHISIGHFQLETGNENFLTRIISNNDGLEFNLTQRFKSVSHVSRKKNLIPSNSSITRASNLFEIGNLPIPVDLTTDPLLLIPNLKKIFINLSLSLSVSLPPSTSNLNWPRIIINT